MVQLHLWLTCGCLFYVLCIKLQVKGSVCSTDLWYPCRVPLIILLSIKMKWLRINQIAYYNRKKGRRPIRLKSSHVLPLLCMSRRYIRKRGSKLWCLTWTMFCEYIDRMISKAGTEDHILVLAMYFVIPYTTVGDVVYRQDGEAKS